LPGLRGLRHQVLPAVPTGDLRLVDVHALSASCRRAANRDRSSSRATRNALTRHFFFGGEFLNSFSAAWLTVFSRLSALAWPLMSVLGGPRHTIDLVLASTMSTTSVPTKISCALTVPNRLPPKP